MEEKNFKINVSRHGVPTIQIGLKADELEIVRNLLCEEIEYLRDNYSECDDRANLHRQNSCCRIKRKISHALERLERFKEQGGKEWMN